MKKSSSNDRTSDLQSTWLHHCHLTISSSQTFLFLKSAPLWILYDVNIWRNSKTPEGTDELNLIFTQEAVWSALLFLRPNFSLALSQIDSRAPYVYSGSFHCRFSVFNILPTHLSILKTRKVGQIFEIFNRDHRYSEIKTFMFTLREFILNRREFIWTIHFFIVENFLIEHFKKNQLEMIHIKCNVVTIKKNKYTNPAMWWL